MALNIEDLGYSGDRTFSALTVPPEDMYGDAAARTIACCSQKCEPYSNRRAQEVLQRKTRVLLAEGGIKEMLSYAKSKLQRARRSGS